MVGLGGGFIVVPVLRLFYGLSPALTAGTSLVLVFANSASGSVAYWRQQRIDVRMGWLVAAGGIPGGILGAVAVRYVSPRIFDWLFAAFLIAVSADMVINRAKRAAGKENAAKLSVISTIAIGLFVGLVSSLFGVGGGVILVPSFSYLSDLPAHFISATSQFAILLTSPVGLITHIVQHDVDWADALPLGAGGILGGAAGARLSLRLKSHVLALLVAVALTIAALALVVRDVLG